jgi:protein-S-isoprenylcysteine O-methyltransferase Ste14
MRESTREAVAVEAGRHAASRVSLPTAVALTAGAVVVAVALTFASVELPRFVSGWLIDACQFPGFDSGRQTEQAEAWIQSHGLRVVGYGSFAAVVIAAVVGLAGGHRRVASAGAIVLFLPVFGHFAASMFFLAGLGMLRVIFLPVLDCSYGLMALGDAAFVPYMALVYPLAVLGVDARDLVIMGAMTSGMAVFMIGVLAWFLEQTHGGGVTQAWVYRYSRHPQYMGWILWSWGLMLYVSRHSELYHFKIAYGVPSSLPWLLSTMVIVGVAMSEEVGMERRFGDEYRRYARKTPFLISLPRAVNRFLSAPMRLVLGRSRPESGVDVLRTVAVYTVLLILLSVPFVLFGWPAATGWYAFPYNVPPFVFG